MPESALPLQLQAGDGTEHGQCPENSQTSTPICERWRGSVVLGEGAVYLKLQLF